MVLFVCDGHGCTERAEAMIASFPGLGGGTEQRGEPPPGWVRMEWIGPPDPPPERLNIPDPAFAALSSVLPAVAVDKFRKAAEAQRIASELAHPVEYAMASRFEAVLCPRCAGKVRLSGPTRIGSTSVPSRYVTIPPATPPPPEPKRGDA